MTAWAPLQNLRKYFVLTSETYIPEITVYKFVPGILPTVAQENHRAAMYATPRLPLEI